MSAASEGEMALPGRLDRPFYFIIVLWGRTFRNYFLECCLASLLSPGNIPTLNTSTRSKFLIATRPEDWAALRDAANFKLLEHYVEPVYIEIPPCPPGRSGCQHMGIGHRIALDMAHRDSAYALVLTPDTMLSDGSIARLQELALAGTQLVVTAALRFGEEPFFAHLRDMGVLPANNLGEDAKPITLTGRQMAYAAVNGFHSETLAYEWDAPGLMAVSPAAWWRVPDEDGIVLHSLSWAPLLLDYASLNKHDTSTFDQWTLDGDYLFNNFNNSKRIHVVQDSDEIFLASWGPMADRPLKKTRFLFEGRLAGLFFKQSFYSGFFDPLKRKLFFLPVRWHAKPLNAKWTAVEERATRELRRWVQPPDETASAAETSKYIAPPARGFSLWALRFIAYGWMFRRRAWSLLLKVMRGDRSAFERIVWFTRTFVLSTGTGSGNPQL
jgi:hypothetical protein